MIFGYVRVSSKEQNESRHVKALIDYCKDLNIESIYIDKQSGKDFNRTNYQELKKRLREGIH